CMLTKVMVNNSLIDNIGAGEVSVASRAGTNRRREFDSVRALKAVTEREPRRHNGISPNSRLSRRQSASSYLQVREKTMSEPIYVGIDVSKDTFNVASCPDVLKTSLPNSPQGRCQLCKHLKEYSIAIVVMEATGGYEKPIVAELLEAQLPAVVVNPRQVRDFARGIGQLAKTDAIDAEVLAKFAQLVQPAPRLHKTTQTTDLAELVHRRRQLNNLRTQESNRLSMAHHQKVQKSVQRVIKVLDQQIAQIDELISEHIKSDDDFSRKDKILRSTPGIGPQTSAMLLSQMPELGNLNRQEIASLAGLAPFDRSSGKWIGRGHIWGGRSEVRNVLYMAALSARNCNPTIRRFANRLESQGKAFKVVITACMRKLLIMLNTMIRNESLWETKIILKNT
ncbi:MAG: IS110 family transposase, partial [Methanosarcinales archaeon]|nr:IS110 family transposase [Methanosarcinales archaeon]